MPGKSEQQRPEDAGRVTLEELPRNEEKLTDSEAKQIKGGSNLGEDTKMPKPTGGRGGISGEFKQ